MEQGGTGESLLIRFPLHKSIVARKKSLSRFLFMIIKEEQSAFFHSLDQPSPNIVLSRCVLGRDLHHSHPHNQWPDWLA